MPPVCSIVVPIYNEEPVLPILLRRLDDLLGQFDGPGEVIFVDDGSGDASSIVCEAKARSDRRFRYVRLSRNFGHQIAISTGLDLARGEAAIVMDGDLQDPPEVVLDMVAQWKLGYEVVSGQRLSQTDESHFKKITADLFYCLIHKLSPAQIPRNVGDFRLVDRKVIDCFRGMPERDRMVRGMFAWLDFKQTVVQFHRPGRAAGQTKYPIGKMARLAVSSLVSFSDARAEQ
jgi:polyisoprenyl-phosphate glycosyltransferase